MRGVILKFVLLALLGTALFFLLNAMLDIQAHGQEPPKLSKESRMAIERYFTAEMAYAHVTFPMGVKGLTLKDGVITPSGDDLQFTFVNVGIACKPGDAVLITRVIIKDNYIRFEINGGPVQKEKWYQHISVGGAGGEVPLSPTNPQQLNAHGSYVDILFDGKYVPELTTAQVKTMLSKVIDFNATSQLDAFLDTVPPKAKEAILAHKVLVGMNSQMVLYALGKPRMKDREIAPGTNYYYEEWIYGTPPGDVTFVRFGNVSEDAVTRIEIDRTGQEAEVRTTPEIVVTKPKEDQPIAPTANRPTLRRPGEQ